jgi:CelD/BcsL family acetyltransferase involved in cellulose biosynthesis
MSFKALQGEWEELFARAAVRTPFLRYSWVQLCWNRPRNIKGTHLFIVIVRKKDRPVLIAPLVRRGPRLSFLDSLTPQYNDVLVEGSDEASAYVDYFWKVLRDLRSVRYLTAQGVRDDSLLAVHLATARQISTGPRLKASFINLEKFGDWETYLQSRSVRRDHRYQLRRLEKLGAVTLRMANCSSCSSDMAWLFAHKRKSLDPMDPSTKWVGAPGTEQFFTAAAKEGIESGRTWLTVLSIDGATIASTLGFREGSTLYLSKMTYDHDWHRYSPGRTQSLLTIARAFQGGLREVDLGFGRYMWKTWVSTGSRRAWNTKVQLE